jgi:ribosomal protein S18 acetylase RimI-like enzyme
VYSNGKHIKNDINVKKKLKLMQIYFDYLMNNECLTDTGMKIGKQVVDLNEKTSFDPTLLPTIPQVTTDKGKELNKDKIYQHIIEFTPKQLESKLNKVVLESYDDLNSKFHYIPLTKKTAKQYASQGIFKYGLNKVHIDDDTKGVIYIDESHVVVGYVAIKKKINGDRWIIGLEVSQEYQNHGYGVDLLNIAVNEFGATFLTVNKNDENSIRMYKQNGWEIYKESDRSVYMRKV